VTTQPYQSLDGQVGEAQLRLGRRGAALDLRQGECFALICAQLCLHSLTQMRAPSNQIVISHFQVHITIF
jgi:hypothetical protein